MGNYFGTCLSQGDINAFSTVANACEANKRVIYVRDDRGKVVGRKLVLLTRSGRLVGFHSYGTGPLDDWWDVDGESGGNPWMKILLDAFCRELADRCGATLHPYPKPAESDPVESDAKLTLFARWYHDGCEAFDWFWRERPPAKWREQATTNPTALAASLLPALKNRDGNAGPTATEAIRLLLWLGDDAVPVLEALVKSVDFADAVKPVTAAVRKHGVGEEVKRWCVAK